MADIFGNSGGIRGCFTHISFNAGNSRGAQLLLPVADTGYGGALPSTDHKTRDLIEGTNRNVYTDPLLCVGIDAQFSDTVLFNKCFGNRVYTYAFGHDPNRSSFTVNLIGFMVDKDRYSKVMGVVLDAYKANRVSASRLPVTLVLGNSKPLEGLMVNIQTNTLDPRHSLQMFRIHCAIPRV